MHHTTTPPSPHTSVDAAHSASALVLIVDSNTDIATKIAGAFATTPHIRPLTVGTVRELFGLLTDARLPVCGLVIDMQTARDIARQLPTYLERHPAFAARLERAGATAQSAPLALVVLALRTLARTEDRGETDDTALLVVFTSRPADESAAAMRAGADLWLSASAAMTEALAAWFDLKLRRRQPIPRNWLQQLQHTVPPASRETTPTAQPARVASATPAMLTAVPAPAPSAPPRAITTATTTTTTSAHRGTTELFHVPDLMTRGPSGRYDARVMADLLGVPLKSLAEWLGMSYEPLKKVPDREAVQSVLQPTAAVLASAWQALGGDDEDESRRRVRAWLRTPHAALGGETPLQGIMARRATSVNPTGVLQQ